MRNHADDHPPHELDVLIGEDPRLHQAIVLGAAPPSHLLALDAHELFEHGSF
jgi:hypothetical protein